MLINLTLTLKIVTNNKRLNHLEDLLTSDKAWTHGQMVTQSDRQWSQNTPTPHHSFIKLTKLWPRARYTNYKIPHQLLQFLNFFCDMIHCRNWWPSASQLLLSRPESENKHSVSDSSVTAIIVNHVVLICMTHVVPPIATNTIVVFTSN